MAEHTPGPWRIERHEINGRLVKIEIYGPEGTGRGGKPIAFLPSGFTNLEADMRLIAASPKLLALCQAARKRLTDLLDDLVTQLDVAIAEATDQKGV